MRSLKLRALIFMALCCDFGLFAKKLISPLTNIITDSLHIPGGIATGFSLMFLVVAAAVIAVPGCAALMGALQSVLALAFGMTGGMGILAPIGYILPGIAIDLILLVFRKTSKDISFGILLSSIAASVTACLTANVITFRLRGLVLLLYALVAATSGAVCGLIATELVKRLRPVIRPGKEIQ